jgi:hypothetical protein
MARTVTATAVKRIITKGLTGWQAGKLVLQDMLDTCLGKDGVLAEADMAAIQQIRMEGTDIRDYNTFMALCRGFHRGHMVGEWACKDACLQIGFLDQGLEDAERRRTVELFESCGPRLVTRKQYDEIVAAQREKKLAFEFGLGYVIEERFYAIAPPKARTAIDEADVDIESVPDFVAAVPEAYRDLCEQAIDQIRQLYVDRKLPLVYDEKKAKEIKPLLIRWKKGRLSPEETMKLVDQLYVTGQTLYNCAGLPEWKAFMDRYQRHWFDDDERFRHAYAVLEDCPEVWQDQKGHYKAPTRPGDWITRRRELLLGLIGHDGEAGKSVERVGAELRRQLGAAERNVRLFLAVKAVLDTATDAVGLDVDGNGGLLAGPYDRLDAFIALFNLHLEELKEDRRHWQSGETRLEKALKMLPTIDVDRLRLSPDSLAQLKANILDDARGEAWLPAKVRSLECGDGLAIKELMD